MNEPLPTAGDQPLPVPDPAHVAEVHQGFLSRAHEVPRHLLDRAVTRVKHTYANLAERYGPGYAHAILFAGLAGLPVPIPFSSAMTAAPVLAAAEVHRALARHGGFLAITHSAVRLTTGEIEALGRHTVHELMHLFPAHADTPSEFEAAVRQHESQLQRPLTDAERHALLLDYLGDVKPG